MSSPKTISGNVEILIVEDSPTQAEQLKRMLEEHGYRVSVAGDGKQALKLMKDRKPTIVISDILMPEMDGYQLCRRIKKDKSLKDIPVILLTSLSDPRDVIKGLECGADNFITKPYDERYLLSRLHYILVNRELRSKERMELGLSVFFEGQKYFLTSDRIQIVDLLLSSYEAAVRLNRSLEKMVEERTASLVSEIAERKRAEEALRVRARQQTAIAELGQCALSGIEISALMDEAVKLVAQTLQVEHCGILELLPDGNALLLRAGFGWERYVGTVINAGLDSHAGYTLISNEPVIIEDLNSEARFNIPTLLRDHGIVSGVSVIIRGQDRPFGVLGAHTTTRRTFTKDDVNFLQAIANVLGMAIKQKRSEKEVNMLAHTVKSISDCVAITGMEGDILFVNEAFLKTYGYDESELAGAHIGIIRSQNNRPDLLQELDAATLSGGWQGELLTRRKDGKDLPVLLRTSMLRDERGRPVALINVLTDITELKRLEDQLRQSQKMEAIGRLAGGIAHDFNNLLTVITGFGGMLLAKLDPASKLYGYAEEVLKASERAGSLTRQLLAFSRRQVLQPEVLNLNSIVSDMDKMLRRLIGEDIDLVTILDPALEEVKADPSQIEQIIMNLAVNARDAMPDGGKLTIETANVELDNAYARQHLDVRPGRYVMLAVSDTGCGMDKETLLHIFEPFFTTKEPGKGTGLGLATVYGIVKQNGGHIWVYSEPGRGTTFKLYLPVAEEAKSSQLRQVERAHPTGTETVLVVEDEEMVRSLICEALTLNGYVVLEASSGDQALKICKQHAGPIHLMVTDVVMPGISGLHLAELAASLRPTMKVLFMSGYTDRAVVHHGELGQSAAFIQKPFTPGALARKVRQVLDSP